MSTSPIGALETSLNKFNQIASLAVKKFPLLHGALIQLLNYSENATYLVENTKRGKYILRIGRPYYHSKAEIKSELFLLQLLAKHTSIHVSSPILGKDKEYVQEVIYEDIPYYCVLFTFLEGDAPDENQKEKLICQFEQLGEITAQLHKFSIQNHHRLQNIERIDWNFETILGPKPKWGRWQEGKAMTRERLELFEEVSEKIRKRLEQYGKDPDRYGLIHSDLRLANLLVEGSQIKVIDFDDCGYGWYVFDLAASLSFIEHKPYVPALINAWMKGYQKVRPLSQEEIHNIPTFIMMRRLQLIAWIGSRDNETTRTLGSQFTEETDVLAKNYLADATYSFF